VGDNCVVAARGLVAGDLAPNSFVSGFPARPHKENMRILAAERKLPELLRRVRQLEQQLASILEDDIQIWEAPEDEE
jgi:UDP-3-O-[3-hydroxymyristoyl] glucosamine N-acyltransferase